MALLEVPFVYEATVVRKRERNERTVALMGRIAARVAEVSSAEAPVAAVLDGQFSPMFSVAAHAARVEYRSWRGGLLRPYWLGMSQPEERADLRLPASPGEAQVDLDAWWRSNEHRCHLLDPGRVHWAGTREGELEARRIVRHDRDARAAEAKAGIEAAAAMVDGVLHLPSGGPAWEIKRRGAWEGQTLRNWVELVPRVEFGWASTGLGRAQLLRGDRRAAAFGEAGRAIRAMQGQIRGNEAVSPEPVVMGDILVSEPLAFSLDDHVASLVVAASESLRFVAETLWLMPPSGLRACADLKEALAAAGAGPVYGAAEAAALLAAATRFEAEAAPLAMSARRGPVTPPVAQWADRTRAVAVDENQAAALEAAARAAIPRI